MIKKNYAELSKARKSNESKGSDYQGVALLGLLDGAVEAVGGSAIELTEVVAEENFEGGIAAAELLPEGIAAAEGAAAAEGTRRDKIRQIEFFYFRRCGYSSSSPSSRAGD